MKSHPLETITLKVYNSPDTPFSEIECRRGLGLQAVAAQNPKLFPVEFDCRQADCGVCLIQVMSDGSPCLSPLTVKERDFLTAMGCSLDGNERLACQARVIANGKIVLIPP